MDGTPLVVLGGAAVVRDPAGDLWLDAGDGGSDLRDHRPGVAWVAAAETLAGGRLPDGAVRVRVRDRAGREHEAEVGDGAWLVLLPQPFRGGSPPVLHLDAAGAIVPVPVPAGVAVEPVADATVPCPACGEVAWDRVVSAPPMRYGSDGGGRPTAALCRRCGHEESLGSLYAPRSEDDAAGADARAPGAAAAGAAEADTLATVAREQAAAVRAARFAPYVLAGLDATPGGWGRSGDVVDSLAFAFATPAGEVLVSTDTQPAFEPPESLARSALAGLLHERDGAWPAGTSQPALELWLAVRSRTHETDAATAPARAVRLPVDGTPVAFACVARDGRFAAVAEVGTLTVTLAGRGAPDGLELARA